MNGPRRLSVVLVWRDPGEGVVESLRTLVAPVAALGGEVIVVTCRPDREVEAARAAIPGARWVRIEPPLAESRAWEAGFAVSRGRIVAFAQARCRYEPGWAEAVLAAGVGPGRVAAGPVTPAPALGLPALAAYLCDYGAFADPEGRGGGAVSSNNVAFDRRDLSAQDLGRGLWKPRLLASRSLTPTWAAGMHAVVGPSARPLAEILPRFRRGRAFAALRASRWPRSVAIVAGLACPALPALLLSRLVADRYLRRRHARVLALGAPWIAALLVSWSLGELAGYWAGAGASERAL